MRRCFRGSASDAMQHEIDVEFGPSADACPDRRRSSHRGFGLPRACSRAILTSLSWRLPTPKAASRRLSPNSPMSAFSTSICRASRALSWPAAFWRAMAAARIIMFSMNDDPIFAARAIEIGAKGYVSKSGDPCDLVEAIREVGEGGVFLPPAIAQQHRVRRAGIRQKTAVETDAARDRDLAPARRRQKPVRDRVAGPFILQDDCQYLVDHSPEARLALILRTRALCDREPAGLSCKLALSGIGRGLRHQRAHFIADRAMTSLLRVPRGGGSDFSAMMRAGRSDRKNSRSASWMASARSWVTNSVVTLVRVVSATSSSRSRAAIGFVERYEGLVEQQKIRPHRKGPGNGRAARKSERQFAGITRQMRAEAQRLDQLASDRRRPRGPAAPAGCFPRPCARAAGAAPETRCRAGRIPGYGARRGNPHPVRRRSSGSSSCRNRKGRSARRTIRLRAEARGRERPRPACRRPTR